MIYRLSQECLKHHQTLNELEEEQTRLKIHIVISFLSSNKSFFLLIFSSG
jgi:hypothetical protein